jgi:hypothetical protein
MRRLLTASMFLALLPAIAQVPPPPQLEPLPEPPPQVGLDTDTTQPGPRIAPGAKVEEFTMPDGTKWVTVTDPNGWQYHLVEAQPGEPAGAQTINSDTGVRPPMWTILQW